MLVCFAAAMPVPVVVGDTKRPISPEPVGSIGASIGSFRFSRSSLRTWNACWVSSAAFTFSEWYAVRCFTWNRSTVSSEAADTKASSTSTLRE